MNKYGGATKKRTAAYVDSPHIEDTPLTDGVNLIKKVRLLNENEEEKGSFTMLGSDDVTMVLQGLIDLKDTAGDSYVTTDPISRKTVFTGTNGNIHCEIASDPAQKGIICYREDSTTVFRVDTRDDTGGNPGARLKLNFWDNSATDWLTVREETSESPVANFRKDGAWLCGSTGHPVTIRPKNDGECKLGANGFRWEEINGLTINGRDLNLSNDTDQNQVQYDATNGQFRVHKAAAFPIVTIAPDTDEPFTISTQDAQPAWSFKNDLSTSGRLVTHNLYNVSIDPFWIVNTTGGDRLLSFRKDGVFEFGSLTLPPTIAPRKNGEGSLGTTDLHWEESWIDTNQVTTLNVTGAANILGDLNVPAGLEIRGRLSVLLTTDVNVITPTHLVYDTVIDDGIIPSYSAGVFTPPVVGQYVFRTKTYMENLDNIKHTKVQLKKQVGGAGPDVLVDSFALSQSIQDNILYLEGSINLPITNTVDTYKVFIESTDGSFDVMGTNSEFRTVWVVQRY